MKKQAEWVKSARVVRSAGGKRQAVREESDVCAAWWAGAAGESNGMVSGSRGLVPPYRIEQSRDPGARSFVASGVSSQFSGHEKSRVRGGRGFSI
jgi:hypothetical protein